MSQNALAGVAILLAAGFTGCAATAHSQALAPHAPSLSRAETPRVETHAPLAQPVKIESRREIAPQPLNAWPSTTTDALASAR